MACIFWVCTEYYYYATVIMCILSFEVWSELNCLKQSEHDLVQLTQCDQTVVVKRDNEWLSIDSSCVIPGDIVQLTPQSKLS